jgi:hypothetical protein
MKYLLLLLPSISFANFVSENGNVTYAEKEYCEKVEQKECFEKPLDAETKKLVDVEVDDLSKPITTIAEPVLVPVLDDEGEPIEGEFTPTCEAPAELVDGKCVTIIAYEKKLEKQFVEDLVKLAEKEAKKVKEEQAQLSCEQFKTLLRDSAINAESKAADVQEVTRRLLGYVKACQL